ncbi:hypothetical protein [Methanospirillum hungatei]|uniref:hypothetical protein n=1 Tax=Methanospirillum hungatei TaxID=2203 RepID=UPI0026E9B622|nr:hypothetical protein [Methanospirillum hungatei]MCA1916363.1 hypothetical protein [Methanospirillum hungatei]
MVIKPATKKTTSKKPASSKTTSKAPVAKSAAAEINLQKVIDLQAKQILKMEKMIQSLDAEVKEIKKQVTSEEKPAPVASKAKTPVKSAVKSSKSVSAVSARKTSAPAKKPAKAPAAAAKKPGSQAGSRSALEDIIEIPKEIADRINALTQAKKVTQTQLGKETDLSQKKIHEIASRKVRDLNKDIIARLTAVIKKYEAK